MTGTGEQIIHRLVATLDERDFDGFGALCAGTPTRSNRTGQRHPFG